jgi:hypothetical protein
MASSAKASIVEAWIQSGAAPSNRAGAGMTANAGDTRGKYVSAIEVTNGVLIVTFGGAANAEIAGLTVTLTPYEAGAGSVVWRCGHSAAPAGLATMGTAGGMNAAAYVAPTVPNEYLPSACRS